MSAGRSTLRHRGLAIGLAAAALLAVDAQPALAAELTNGDFETGELEPWETLSRAVDGAEARWSVIDGEAAPISGFPIPPPSEGDFQAVADQNAPGVNILYQDFDVGTAPQRLTMTFWYRNYAEVFITPKTFNFTQQRNQQLRIDLMRPGSAVRSLDPDDILASIFRTRRGDPSELEPTELRFNLRPFEGQRVRLRIAQVATEFFFNVGVDDVSVGPPDGGRIGLTPVGRASAGTDDTAVTLRGAWRG